MRTTKEILVIILTILLILSQSISIYAKGDARATVTLQLENPKVGDKFVEGDEIIVAIKVDVENMLGITAFNAGTISYDNDLMIVEKIIVLEGWQEEQPGRNDIVYIARKNFSDDVPSGSIIAKIKFKVLKEFKQTDMSLKIIDLSDSTPKSVLSILDECNEPELTIKPQPPTQPPVETPQTLNYKVEYYKQNADKSGYTLAEEQNLTGTEGQTVTAQTKSYSGYTLNSQKSNISGQLVKGQSLVLKLYYDIIDVIPNTPQTLNYKVEHYKQKEDKSGYDLAEEQTLTGTEGQTVTAQAKAYSGYTLNSQTSNISGKLVKGQDLVLKLYYDLSNGKTVKYRVEYYKQNTEKTAYDLAEVTELTGVEGQTVVAENKQYEGYVENTGISTKSGTLVDGQELVLKVYYDYGTLSEVTKYKVTFKDGNNVLKVEEVEKGKSATAPTITKAGYTLSWDKSFNNVTSDITVNAVWTKNQVQNSNNNNNNSNNQVKLPQTGDVGITIIAVISGITILGGIYLFKYRKMKEF